VTASIHIIVEAETQTGTVRLDAGAGVDPPKEGKAEVGLFSSGNFGDPTTGVIAKPNMDLLITGPPGNPNINKPLLTDITPKSNP
jgi:hypothetical protein